MTSPLPAGAAVVAGAPDPKKLGAERTVPWERTPGALSEGLTKREWFAAVALQGTADRYPAGQTLDDLVKSALRISDAILAELAKVQP